MNQSNLKLPKMAGPKSFSAGERKDAAMIRNALKQGYLQIPSVEFIWNNFKDQSDFNRIYEFKAQKKSKTKNSNENEITNEDLKLIKLLSLQNTRIVELGDIMCCVNLKILNLSNNHLANIEPLSSCINLFRLDLQKNQILILPDREFWASMTQLKVLFLHDNPLGRLEYLKHLAACPSLEVLTMYDTPISIKYNYRHHAVNSILTLKCLDEFVVSDEEIIEEADFCSIFKSKTFGFRIHNTIQPAEDNSYKSELKATYKLIKKINRVIAHYSPVHIVQKYIRGYLARKHYKQIKFKIKERAARKIQIWWKKMHHKKFKKNIDIQLGSNLFKPNESEIVHHPGRNTEKSSSFSHSFVDDHFKVAHSDEVHSKADFIHENTELNDSYNEIDHRKRNIIIDLNKLGKFQSLFDISNSNFSGLQTNHTNRDLQHQNQQQTKNEESKFISLSRFMSMIQENLSNEENKTMLENLNSDPEIKEILKMHKIRKQLEKEDQFTDFRLPILVPRSYALNMRDNFVIDLVREKHIGANSIKLMENDIHKKMNEMRQEIKQVNKEQFVTNDQRFFQKAFGNMSLGCLRAVDKAYEDRTQVEKRTDILKKIEKQKEQHKYSKERVQYYKEDRIKGTHESHKEEVQLVLKSRVKLEQDYEDLKERVQDLKQKRIDMAQKRQKDIHMAVDFSKQHLSVSKALQKHEHLTSLETKKLSNNDFVVKLKANNEKQRELVKKYTTQRNILRLIQSTNDRVLIQKKLKENVEEEDFQAKLRVERLKALEFKGYRQNCQTGRTTMMNNPTSVVNLLYSFRPISFYSQSGTRYHDMETFNNNSPILVPENTDL